MIKQEFNTLLLKQQMLNRKTTVYFIKEMQVFRFKNTREHSK